MPGNYGTLGLSPGAIKSKQAGVSVGTTTATVSSVNTAKALLTNLGNPTNMASVVLTNSTTITITASSGNTSWQLVEYY